MWVGLLHPRAHIQKSTTLPVPVAAPHFQVSALHCTAPSPAIELKLSCRCLPPPPPPPFAQAPSHQIHTPSYHHSPAMDPSLERLPTSIQHPFLLPPRPPASPAGPLTISPPPLPSLPVPPPRHTWVGMTMSSSSLSYKSIHRTQRRGNVHGVGARCTHLHAPPAPLSMHAGVLHAAPPLPPPPIPQSIIWHI